MFTAEVEVPHDTAANNKLAEKRAEDSTNMVATALYSSPIPSGDPVAVRIFLPWRTSRMTIMRVTITLSESEIEKYATFQGTRPTAKYHGKSPRMPVAISPAVALSVTTARGEFKYVPTEPRYMRQGKAIAQRFLE